MDLKRRRGRPGRSDWLTWDQLSRMDGAPVALFDMRNKYKRLVGRVLYADPVTGQMTVRTRAGDLQEVTRHRVRRARLMPGLFRPYEDDGWPGDIVHLVDHDDVRAVVVTLEGDGRRLVCETAEGRRYTVDDDRAEHADDRARRRAPPWQDGDRP